MGIQDERQPLLPKPSSAVDEYDPFVECKPSPACSPNDGAGKVNGALREGPPPDLHSIEMLTLLAQFAGVGFASGALPGAIYPVFQGYLNAEGTTIASASMLVHLPWSFKVVFGLLSDCVPIGSYRRAPYMALGWSFSCAMLLFMGSIPMGEPYYIDPALRSTDPDTWTPEQWQEINVSAPDEAGTLVVPMMLAAFGFLVAEVAADSTVVELAQREPIETRGTLQSAAHSIRMACSALGALTVAFAFNSVDYGGSFSFSLSFPQLMGVMGWLCAPLVLAALLLLQHEPKVRAPPLKTYAARFWAVLQKRAVLQIAAYKFFSGVLNSFNIVASSNIKAHWVHATPFNSSVMHVVGTFVYAATLAVTARHGLQWNWRLSIALTVIVGIVLDGFMTMLVTWDVIRNQWFWLGVPVVGHIPEGVRFIIANYVVVELIEPGSEGALYGLLTTTANLSSPVGKTSAKLVNAHFHVWEEDILRDSFETRRDVTITIWICYSLKLASLALLPLLPKQKREMQALRQAGGSSKRGAVVMLLLLAVALTWATSVNLLSLDERTKCWAITGGCPNHSH
jgi:hypothetical protein